MAINVEELLIRIDADLASLNAKMGEAKKVSVNTADAIAARFSRMGEELGKTLIKLGKVVSRLALVGSAALVAMAKLGAEAGKATSEGARLASDAFVALGNRLTAVNIAIAEGMAPLLARLVTWFDKLIAKMGGFGAISAKVADVTRTAVKLAGDAWQGFGIILNSIGAAAKGLEVVFWSTAKGISQGFQVVAGTATQAWEVVRTGFDASFTAIKATWVAVQAALQAGFFKVTESLGKMLRATGDAIAGLRIEGMADMGRDLSEAGANLIVSGVRGIESATQGLDAAVAEAQDKAADFSDALATLLSPGNVDFDTSFIDAKLADARLALDEFRIAVKETVADIQENGSLGSIFAADIPTLEAALAEQAMVEERHNSYMMDKRREWAEALQKQQDELDMFRISRAEFVAFETRRIQNEEALADQRQLATTEAMWRSSFQARAQLMGTFFSSMAVLQESNSRKMFEVGKGAAIAEAITSTYLAANKAYAALAGIPVIGPGLGAAAAGAAIVAGVANVNRIRNTKFGQGGSGGGGGSGGSSNTGSPGGESVGSGGAVAKNTNVNVTLQGERFSASQVRGLISAINDQTQDNVKLNVRTL
jgi:uncharacterized membrane protein YgcG